MDATNSLSPLPRVPHGRTVEVSYTSFYDYEEQGGDQENDPNNTNPQDTEEAWTITTNCS